MRGLLAIEPLYHKIVSGEKTQTRRSSGLEQVNGRRAVIKKGVVVKDAIDSNPDDWEIIRYNNNHAKFGAKGNFSIERYCVPRYHVGEILYLKEPYALYRSYGGGKDGLYAVHKYGCKEEYIYSSWKNKLFMPQSAARAYIKITGIRCERLLDISHEDAIAEGVSHMPLHGYKDYLSKSDKAYELTAKESFFSLYMFANKVKEIENIWCWVYEFTYLKDYQP